jgi:hypothetical protein
MEIPVARPSMPELTNEEVRNAAICLLAADSALCDSMTPERAVAFIRGIEEAMNTEECWANGRHEGDCTKKPFSCARCMFEEAEDEARRRFTD